MAMFVVEPIVFALDASNGGKKRDEIASIS
jgi:hypothetical protein